MTVRNVLFKLETQTHGQKEGQDQAALRAGP